MIEYHTSNIIVKKKTEILSNFVAFSENELYTGRAIWFCIFKKIHSHGLLYDNWLLKTQHVMFLAVPEHYFTLWRIFFSVSSWKLTRWTNPIGQPKTICRELMVCCLLQQNYSTKWWMVFSFQCATYITPKCTQP